MLFYNRYSILVILVWLFQYISRKKVLFLLLFSLFFSLNLSAEKLSKGIIPYKPLKDKGAIYGALKCKGSTNVGKLLNVWIPAFKKFYPDVKVNKDFRGSSEAILGLMEGNTTIGAMSRPISKYELNKFIKQKGYKPIEIKVALDAIAIYVYRLNPINTITLEKLDAIFSQNPKRTLLKPITNWKSINGKDAKINIYLFDKKSGSRAYFQKKVMLKEEYNQDNIVADNFVKNKELIEKIANDYNGIGFASVDIQDFRVKRLSLSKREHYPIYAPTDKNIKNGTYPLTRFFYIYLDVPPDMPIPPLIYEFCKFILSYNGQNIVLKNGGLPLSPKQIGIELSKIRSR